MAGSRLVLEIISYGLAAFMAAWGVLNLFMPAPPYGDIGRVLGVGQIAFSAVLIYATWRY